MNPIRALGFRAITDLILGANKRVFLALPSISEEIASTLLTCKSEIGIFLLIDNSEEVIRNGYGDVKGIEKCLGKNINIFQSNGNLISFLICDDKGYFIFPESRIFNDEPKGTNAFPIDPATINILIEAFFKKSEIPFVSEFDKQATIGNAIRHFENLTNEVQKSLLSVSKFDTITFDNVKRNIEVNPPLAPDLKRQINTYNSKIQFVELTFNGGGLENRIAKLPEDALPFNSPELKQLLLARIKMFHDITSKDGYVSFLKLKEDVAGIREDFLTPISSRKGKSIIKAEDKANFTKAIESTKSEIKKVTNDLITLLQSCKIDTLDLLRKELISYFNNNEPEELKRINDIDIRKRVLKDMIDDIVRKVQLPKIGKLVDEITIGYQFYDLTWDDFKDKKLLDEFQKKEIMGKDDLNSIVRMKDAFETKR